MNLQKVIINQKKRPILSIEEDNDIAAWSIKMAKCGCGKTKSDIQNTVKQIWIWQEK